MAWRPPHRLPVWQAQAGIMPSAFGPQTTIVVGASIAMVIGVCAMLFLRPVTRLR